MSAVDPRLAVIGERLAGVRRILAVTGGKGGIGKSVVASTLALILAEEGRRVGLLDLDLTGPCAHVILGADPGFPTESFGVDPPEVHGVRFMSIACFVGARPAPLRGGDVSNALIELLAITLWGELDALVVDMPPGLGDATLDAVRLLERAEYLVVANASRVVLETVSRMVGLLQRVDGSILGIVENMRRNDSQAVDELARKTGLPLLGEVPWDEQLEDALGEPQRLLRTDVARSLGRIARPWVG